jgi:hypothetical protein
MCASVSSPRRSIPAAICSESWRAAPPELDAALWVDLQGAHELSRTQLPRQEGRTPRQKLRQLLFDELGPLPREGGRMGRRAQSQLLDARMDDPDLLRSGPTASAHEPRAERDGVAREGLVVRTRHVGIEDAAAEPLREACVRHDRERQLHVARQALQHRQARLRPQAAVDTEQLHAPALRHLGSGAGRTFTGCQLSMLVEAHRHQKWRALGDASHRLDGEQELIEPRESLEEEQIHSAIEQALRLLLELPYLLLRSWVGVEEPIGVEGADRARNPHRLAARVARSARDLHCFGENLLAALGQADALETCAAGTERVRRDDSSPRDDVAQVDALNGLGMGQVDREKAMCDRGRSFTRERTRDHRAHGAIGDEDVLLQLLEKAMQCVSNSYELQLNTGEAWLIRRVHKGRPQVVGGCSRPGGCVR